jgi:hypothetical protein
MDSSPTSVEPTLSTPSKPSQPSSNILSSPSSVSIEELQTQILSLTNIVQHLSKSIEHIVASSPAPKQLSLSPTSDSTFSTETLQSPLRSSPTYSSNYVAQSVPTPNRTLFSSPNNRYTLTSSADVDETLSLEQLHEESDRDPSLFSSVDDTLSPRLKLPLSILENQVYTRFLQYSSFGNREQRGSMTSFLLHKLCRESGITHPKLCSENEIDLIFIRLMSRNGSLKDVALRGVKMPYSLFLNLLLEIGCIRYRHIKRKLDNLLEQADESNIETMHQSQQQQSLLSSFSTSLTPKSRKLLPLPNLTTPSPSALHCLLLVMEAVASNPGPHIVLNR